MTRQDLLNRISTYLGRFTEEVKQLNKASLYDINIHSENVLIPLLKEIFSCSGLHNANDSAKNFPAVDLIDYENRIAFQVTATADAQKIIDTLTTFRAKKQEKAFDQIIVYIITARQKKYTTNFNELLPDGFEFDAERDIIDNPGLFEIISRLPNNISKLERIAALLAEEFADVKIKSRYGRSIPSNQTPQRADPVFPNLMELIVPTQLYQADLPFDFDNAKKELIKHLKNKQQYYKIKHITGRDVVNYLMGIYDDAPFCNFVLRGGKVFTFRNLYSLGEPLRKLIDIGTITPLSPEEYIGDSEDREKIFKDLLNSSLRQEFAQNEIEWIDDELLYRFKIGKALNARKVSYKSKLGRGVIFEVFSKKDKHIICFRHLAFSLTYHQFGDKWFLSLKPNWSFTSNGHKASRFSSSYMAKLKRMEYNDTLYDQFTFLSEYLSHLSQGDIGHSSFLIKLQKLSLHFKTSPAIPDVMWEQSASKGKKIEKIENQIELLF